MAAETDLKIMHLLIRRLQNLVPLNDHEQEALLGLSAFRRRVKAKKDLAQSLLGRNNLYLIESGFACRYKQLSDGRRQILSVSVPGDIGDLRVYILGRPDSEISTLSDVTISVIDGEKLLAATDRFPQIARALWSATLVEESITREWLVSLGQRSALERMAHLLCELHARLDAVGRVERGAFDMPITQSELADTLGLSSVHVNRTLQTLRRRDFIVFEDKVMHLKDIRALTEIAMFNPGYLHFRASTDRTDPLLRDAG